MCGILTVVSKNGQKLDLAACRRALSYLTLRGPDYSSYHVWDNKVFLGQTILSITGEIYNSDEHLISVSNRYQMIFNGEIYNYRELKEKYLNGKIDLKSYGGTDTQVLINLHEVFSAEDVPKKLDGMYAYCALDKKDRKLHICRDLQGEKSVYVFESGELIIISSEINPILCLVPRLQPDPQVLRDYFYMRHFMFLNRTLYPEVRQLLPGHIETIDLKTTRWSKYCYQTIEQFIDLSRMEKNEKRSKDDLADELDSLLWRAVKEMIPQQRKYAAVVSGGVDSSLIAHYTAQLGNPDILIAVNHIGNDRISSDLTGFEKVFNRKITTLNIDAFTYSSEIMRCQRICRSPLMSHSFIGQAIQSSYIRSQRCHVLFGGDGADEFFGGYPCYYEYKSHHGLFSPSPYSEYKPAQLEFINNDTAQLQNELKQTWQRSLDAYKHIQNDRNRTVQAMMHCDASWQLPAVGLRGSDLMSLMWNIETRSVFLRLPIIDFALNLPVSVKSDNSFEKNPLLWAKPLLKKLFLRYFPESLLVEKQGFAGFPNEAARYIGDLQDFLAIDFLGIRREPLISQSLDRETRWKLVNIEYFLRYL